MSDLPKRRTRSRRTAPTIEDVARQAGVSPMTVSRVINGAPTVREATRQVVRAAIKEIGYEPNEAARSLAGARQIQIAMLYAQPSAFIAEFLFGGLEQVRRLNAQFIIEKCGDSAKAETEIERIIAGGADGLLVAPPLADSSLVLDFLEANDIPAVVVSSSRVRDSVSAVGVDAFKAAREMTAHLISLGHRRVGHIAGHPEHATSELRLAGYRDALHGASLPFDDQLVAKGLYTYRSGLDAAEKLLGLEERPTAIFAGNDEMAAAAAAVAHRLGLDVPADLSICGYDDTPLAKLLWPQLTTIHVPIAELSRAAADLLVKAIRARWSGQRMPPQHILLDYTLVRRHSDAPPRVRPRSDPAEPS